MILLNTLQRRVWESQDFTITKIVVEEGQDGDNGEMMMPRFGAACSVQGEQHHSTWLRKWFRVAMMV